MIREDAGDAMSLFEKSDAKTSWLFGLGYADRIFYGIPLFGKRSVTDIKSDGF